MIGIETNVLVRLIVVDDLAQFAVTDAFAGGPTEAAPGYVCPEVVAELVSALEGT